MTMEFLVHITISLPAEMPAAQAADLYAAEGARAAALRAAGALRRIWRDPGKSANWSLYEVSDPGELHLALCSLPLWPWMSVEVFPLAVHPAEMEPTAT